MLQSRPRRDSERNKNTLGVLGVSVVNLLFLLFAVISSGSRSSFLSFVKAGLPFYGPPGSPFGNRLAS